MRISDWSSDVCSSDLVAPCLGHHHEAPRCELAVIGRARGDRQDPVELRGVRPRRHQIARLARTAGGKKHERGGAVVERHGVQLAIGSPVNNRLQQPASHGSIRSEEHTSELQSLMRTSYAVFRLNKKTTETKIT